MEIRFDTYYTYADLTERLAWLAEQHPDIMQLSALGKSHEGREIPLVILTNTANRAGYREAGLLDRRQHPRHRADRVDGRALLH